MKYTAAAVCAASALFCLPAHAYDVAEEADTYSEGVHMAKRWLLHLNVDKMTFDEEAAWEQGVESDAMSFSGQAEYFFNDNVSASFGLSFVQYDELYSFTQTTESIYGGDVRESSSDASAMTFLFDVGYTKFFGDRNPVYATGRIGVEQIFASEHGIDDCSDCSSIDIDLDAGAFIHLGTGIVLARSFAMGVYYKAYPSGDLENAVGLKLTFGRFRD